ncbi:MAG: penicillin-binding protein 2 [Planctomycetota bacterium]|nr:penicillin-binding protein 2 [Planctomycetota bacterium]
MSDDTPKTPAQAHRRTDAYGSLAITLMVMALLVLLARVAQLQYAPSPELVAQVQSRTSRAIELGIRGDLLDRRDRPMSVTRVGYRLCIDPTRVDPDRVDEAIIQIAEATESSPDSIGQRLIWAKSENARRAAGQASLPPPWARSDRDAEAAAGSAERAEVPGGSLDSPSGEANSRTSGSTPENESTVKPRPRKPVQWVPLTGVLTDAQTVAARALDVPGLILEPVPVRTNSGGERVASLVGFVGFDQTGLAGAELSLDERLRSDAGLIRYVRDSRGNPLWIQPSDLRPARHGEDVRLSIDLEIQRIVDEELSRGVAEADAAGGRCVVLLAATGEVLAISDQIRDLPGLAEYPWVVDPKYKPRPGEDPPAPRPVVNSANLAPGFGGAPRYRTLAPDEDRAKQTSLARNRCVEDVYEPGSTFKPFVWATITELGLARPDEVFQTEGGRWRTSYGRPIEDVIRRQIMTWNEVLVNSSNIGMVKAAERMSFKQLRDVAVRFGFGQRTGIGLPGEATGLVTPVSAWSKYSQTSVAYGHEIAVTPIQMARAFAAFCRTGDDAGTIPPVTLRASSWGVGREAKDLKLVLRVLPPKIANLTRETMAAVAHNMESRIAEEDRPEGGWRYTMFGKSGTAEIPLGKAPRGMKRPPGASGYYDNQYNSSFIAGGPSEDPKLVVIVVIDDPGPERVRKRTHYGAYAAGPVVRRVMERALTYMAVPPSPAPAVQDP